MSDTALGLLKQWQQYLAERPLPTADPRPDLHMDHALWQALLSRAHGGAIHGAGPDNLFWALQGLRCCGASLVWIDKHLYLKRGQMSQAEYDQARERYLMPHAQTLKELVETVEEGAKGKHV